MENLNENKINHKNYKISAMNAWIKYKKNYLSKKKFKNKEILVILEITF